MAREDALSRRAAHRLGVTEEGCRIINEMYGPVLEALKETTLAGTTMLNKQGRPEVAYAARASDNLVLLRREATKGRLARQAGYRARRDRVQETEGAVIRQASQAADEASPLREDLNRVKGEVAALDVILGLMRAERRSELNSAAIRRVLAVLGEPSVDTGADADVGVGAGAGAGAGDEVGDGEGASTSAGGEATSGAGAGASASRGADVSAGEAEEGEADGAEAVAVGARLREWLVQTEEGLQTVEDLLE